MMTSAGTSSHYLSHLTNYKTDTSVVRIQEASLEPYTKIIKSPTKGLSVLFLSSSPPETTNHYFRGPFGNDECVQVIPVTDGPKTSFHGSPYPINNDRCLESVNEREFTSLPVIFSNDKLVKPSSRKNSLDLENGFELKQNGINIIHSNELHNSNVLCRTTSFTESKIEKIQPKKPPRKKSFQEKDVNNLSQLKLSNNESNSTSRRNSFSSLISIQNEAEPSENKPKKPRRGLQSKETSLLFDEEDFGETDFSIEQVIEDTSITIVKDDLTNNLDTSHKSDEIENNGSATCNLKETELNSPPLHDNSDEKFKDFENEEVFQLDESKSMQQYHSLPILLDRGDTFESSDTNYVDAKSNEVVSNDGRHYYVNIEFRTSSETPKDKFDCHSTFPRGLQKSHNRNFRNSSFVNINSADVPDFKLRDPTNLDEFTSVPCELYRDADTNIIEQNDKCINSDNSELVSYDTSRRCSSLKTSHDTKEEDITSWLTFRDITEEILTFDYTSLPNNYKVSEIILLMSGNQDAGIA